MTGPSAALTAKPASSHSSQGTDAAKCPAPVSAGGKTDPCPNTHGRSITWDVWRTQRAFALQFGIVLGTPTLAPKASGQPSACDAGRAAAPNAGQPLLAVPRRAHLASDGGSATSGRDDEDAKRVAGGVGINPERLLLVVGAVHEHLGAQGQGALVGRVQLSPVGHG